jgi:dTDP-glucose 4,6-dehydratase
MVCAIIGKPLQIELDAERMRPAKSEVLRLLSDNSLARRLLGWQPEVSIGQGLEKTIAWISDHLDLFQPNQYQR